MVPVRLLRTTTPLTSLRSRLSKHLGCLRVSVMRLTSGGVRPSRLFMKGELMARAEAEIDREYDAARTTARRIVAEWLIEVWADRPEWLRRMPDDKEVKSLTERIRKELGT